MKVPQIIFSAVFPYVPDLERLLFMLDSLAPELPLTTSHQPSFYSKYLLSNDQLCKIVYCYINTCKMTFYQTIVHIRFIVCIGRGQYEPINSSCNSLIIDATNYTRIASIQVCMV